MKNKFRNIVCGLVIVLCAIVGTASAIYVICYCHNKVEQNKIFEKMRELKQGTAETAEELEDARVALAGMEEKQILEEYQELYAENNDMFGWIRIEGTKVDYPVMFTPNDPNFYETRNWKKEKCYGGVGYSIFIDGRTPEGSCNIILYGHNKG